MESGYAAVLIDVVDSRRHRDRRALQRFVAGELATVNERVSALDPLTETVGDEIQGTYADPVTAVRAVVELRLALRGRVDIRAGVGWGDIVIHDPARTPFGQDGPAWWAAREALDAVAGATTRGHYPARMMLRVAGSGADDAATRRAPPEEAARGCALPDPRPLRIDGLGLLHSQLALLDRAVATVDAVEAAIVLADIRGVRTAAIATSLDLTPSAISQRRTRNHLRELVVALRLMETSA